MAFEIIKLTYLPQITCASALPGKTEKHENCIFHSNTIPISQGNTEALQMRCENKASSDFLLSQ